MRAVVVGSGPNGLAGAIRLAQAGLDVTVLEAEDRLGGGVGSAELTVPGVVHDLGAAFLPMAAASPFLRSLRLQDHGARLLEAEVALAHPLDSGAAGVLHRDIEQTALGLGADGAAWRRSFGELAAGFDRLAGDVLRPLMARPVHPALLGRFGTLAALPASRLVARFDTAAARGLFAGTAAHRFGRLDRPFSSAIGVMLTAAGHAHGWPVVAGGAGRLTSALVSVLEGLGGRCVTGVRVSSLVELGSADVVLLDVSPRAALRLLGGAGSPRVRRAYSRYSYGPAAFKVDFAIDGDVPWKARAAARAGVLHLGGSATEVARTEALVARGRMPSRPFTLVGQQYLADPSRSSKGINPVWSYAHVPAGYTGDATSAIVSQIERFAPGFRERIVATHVTDVARLSSANRNFVGGDINTGATTFRQTLARPLAGRRPYATGAPGVYLCSSAAAPGPGVHGMAGLRAAEEALSHL